jgi:exodeoxyribonuclease VII small subunit
MEKEDVSLEQSFDLYYKGMELLKRCGEKIDRIEKKMVMLDDKGEEHEF